MKSLFPTCSRTLQTAAVSALTLIALTACGDKKEDAPAPEQPTPAVDNLQQTRDALFNETVYTLINKVSDPNTFPMLNAEVKVLLEQLEAYYTELTKTEGGSAERAKLALLIAKTTSDLGAVAKAQDAYTRAADDLAKLSKKERDSAEGQHALIDIENGLGFCALAQNKGADALPHYQAAMDAAQKQFNALAPAEGETLEGKEIAPELSQATADLLDSIRCLGDCQRFSDDPEEARTTYLKGQELVTRLKTLSSEMSIAYVKLLTALGNLDNSNGKPEQANAAWVLAAQICQQLNASSNRLDIKFETKRCFDALLPAIQNVQAKLKEQQPEQAPAEQGNAATEPISGALPPAEQAPTVAPEPAAQPAQPAKAAPAKPAPAKPAKNTKKRK